MNFDRSSSFPTTLLDWVTHQPTEEMPFVDRVPRLRFIVETTDETLDRVETRRGNSFRYSPSPLDNHE